MRDRVAPGACVCGLFYSYPLLRPGVVLTDFQALVDFRSKPLSRRRHMLGRERPEAV